ncbi:MAG: hypothetical protein ACREVK_07325 [Gammaproteobacteria bacterium]
MRVSSSSRFIGGLVFRLTKGDLRIAKTGKNDTQNNAYSRLSQPKD